MCSTESYLKSTKYISSAPTYLERSNVCTPIFRNNNFGFIHRGICGNFQRINTSMITIRKYCYSNGILLEVQWSTYTGVFRAKHSISHHFENDDYFGNISSKMKSLNM